jgi:hypothetical protein
MITCRQKHTAVLFTILYLIVNISISAQTFNNTIQGNVTDSTSGESLPNVNIFLSGTTWGTSSDLNGKFQLSSIVPGNYELVFSMIGYDSETRKITINDSSKLFFEIKLSPKFYLYKDVVIIEDIPTQWFEDLKLFKEKFLGYSSVTIECEIKNELQLEFSHPEENILIAECGVPLEIINYTLGYKILCEIENFEYDASLNKLRQKYNLFFIDLDSPYSKNESIYSDIRRKVYKKSIYYFLKTLITRELSETEFLLFLTNSIQRFNSSSGIELLSSNHIIDKNISDDTFKLEFDGYLRVERYSIQLLGMSWIKLNLPFITIDRYGYPVEEYALTLSGGWARHGIATLLPKNYAIEEEYYNEE